MLCMLCACKTVPVTGRKQLNLVPNSMIQALAFSQYDSVVKVSATLSQNDERAQMVTRTGTKIQQAVEMYMQQNNMSKEIEIVISEDGEEVSIDLIGFKGQGCSEIAKKMRMPKGIKLKCHLGKARRKAMNRIIPLGIIMLHKII